MRRALLTLVLASACVEGKGGPEAIAWDRDACTECTMVISDHGFAAELRSPKGAVHKFDDVGCAVHWLAKQTWANDPAAMIWVARNADGKWLDARQAHYLAGKTSPMGYGFAAQDPADLGITFDAMRAQVLAITSPKALLGRTP